MAGLSCSEEEEEEEEESEYEEESEEEETDQYEVSSRSGSSDDDDDDDDDDRKGKATDEELCNKVIDLLERGKNLRLLKLTECKAYLRKHELRISGTKATCIERILEHWRIKDGNGEKLYPNSSFSINCTGDVCKGDVILFKQRVYEKFDIVKRGGGGNIIGTRTIAGKVVKESYGAAKQQHTFTVEILWCKGTKAWPPLYPLLVKGRNLYRLKTFRQPWNSETERSKVLAEKHKRGATARHVRTIAKSTSENRASKKYSSSRVPPYMRKNKERESNKNKMRNTRDITPSVRRRSNTSKQVAEKGYTGPSISHPKESSSEQATETRHPLAEVRYQQSSSNRVAESRYLGPSVAEPRYSGSSLAETVLYPRSLIAHSERSNSNRVVETMRYPGLSHVETRYQSSSIAHPDHYSIRGQYGLSHGVPYNIYNQTGQERIGMPVAYHQPRREMLHQPSYIMEHTSSAGRVPYHHMMSRSESYISNPYVTYHIPSTFEERSLR